MKNLPGGSLVCCLILFAVLACGGGKPVAAKYQGDWVGENGTTLYMYDDGKAGSQEEAKQ